LVREAINYAIDRDAIIKGVLKGHAFPLHCLYFPGQLGYTDSCTGYAYDPAKAKELLAQAGYPNGVTIQQNCTIGDVPSDQDIGVAVQGQLAQVGIKTQLSCLPADTQSANYVNGKAVGMLFWDLGPLIIFDTSRYCNVYLLPGGAYYGYVNTTQLESLCAQAATATTDDARKALYQQIQDIAVNQQALWAPLYEAANVYGVNKKLNWSVQPTSGQDLYLEDATWSS
jgi:ABC-type transport system substrate-binding protein